MATNFPNGLLSGGAPVLTAGAQFGNPFSNHLYVDAKLGSDAYTLEQNSPEQPFLTMERAFTLVKSGDVIHVRGKVREQLTTPAGVFDVSIVGAGNRPRHADDHTESNGKRGSSAATWTAPASGSTATPLLTIIQQGWRIHGITFQLSGSADACIYLNHNDGAGDNEQDAGHAEITYCKIQSNPSSAAGNGIEADGVGFVKIAGCLIFGFVNGIVNGAGGGNQVGWWEIIGNRIIQNTNGIDLPLYYCSVQHNQFGANTVDLDLTSGQFNVVTPNYFFGNTAFENNTAGTSDLWFGSISSDTASADVETDGSTNAIGWVLAAPNGS